MRGRGRNDRARASLADLQAKGYVLAQGRKRLVVVDPHGKAHNPTRLVKGIRAKDLHALLQDIDLNRLPDASAVQMKMQFRDASRKHGAVRPEPQATLEVKPDLQAKEKARQDALMEKAQKERENFRQQHRRRMKFTKRSLLRFIPRRNGKPDTCVALCQIRQAPWWKRLLGITHSAIEKVPDQQARQYRNDLEKYREKLIALKQQAHDGWQKQKIRQTCEWRNLEKIHVPKAQTSPAL